MYISFSKIKVRGGDDAISESIGESDEGDSVEKIDLTPPTDDNELDVEMETDIEMGLDVGKVLRRIYNKEVHLTNLRKGGQDSLVQYILTDKADRENLFTL